MMETKKYMTIDDVPVPIADEVNILELIRKVGVDLPTFCYYSELSVYGACRMCMVEDAWGGMIAACSTPPKEGMAVKTNTQRLRRYRKNILQLLLANHCRDCTTCEKNGSCRLQDLSMRYHVDHVALPSTVVETPQDHSSYSITREPDKCILCGDCVRMCNEIQTVGAIDFAGRGCHMTIATAFDQPLAESPCIGCGKCASVCPTGAITVKNDTEKVWKLLDDPAIHVSCQIAPAVRTSLAKTFGLEKESNAMGKIVAALRKIGFDEVYDTSSGADLTVLEEANELINRLEEGEHEYPLFTSCCPAWVNFCEREFPDLLGNLSTCKSPMQMFSAVIRTQREAASRPSAHVAIMPCTAKKFEAGRSEFSSQGNQDVTASITTQELIQMIRESGIVFKELQEEAVDRPFGSHSGAGVIFGVSGGVTEAVLRRITSDKSRAGLVELSYTGVRGMEGVKECYIPYGDRTLRIAVVSGLGNARKLIESIRQGDHFDFIEVMACPGGCVNGGGQPPAKAMVETESRGRTLYTADRLSTIRRSEENPLMMELYNGLLKGRIHELLHVDYAKSYAACAERKN